MTAATAPDSETLIDALLREQRDMTAVDRFSSHTSVDSPIAPALEKYYRDLLPLTAPGPGEQYAFEVDLDSCSGCKACVTACHSLNGLDEDETWRDIGQLLTGPARQPTAQTITTACHHCADPACLTGCPVVAYEKDNATGIVRHLDDQCIGCQYCSLMCPYDVPKYSAKRGIVRKCDMCHGRLTHGEAPACVQGCPNGAITIRLVSTAALRERAAAGEFLEGAPDPSLTCPSTTYSTSRSFISEPLWGELEEVTPAPDHWPLVWMLVLMQASAGVSLMAAFAQFGSGLLPDLQLVSGAALLLCVAGTIVSVTHLGRPPGAWRWFLGLKTSWLSREIAAFSFYGFLLGAQTSAVFLLGNRTLHFSLVIATAAAGLAATAASVWVYHATKRDFWRWSLAGPKFFATSGLLGSVICWALTAVSGGGEGFFACTTALFATVKSVTESNQRLMTPGALHRTRRLLFETLGAQSRVRMTLLLMGGVVGPLVWFAAGAIPAIAISSAILCAAGEVMERRLFFRAVSPGKMPGVPSS